MFWIGIVAGIGIGAGLVTVAVLVALRPLLTAAGTGILLAVASGGGARARRAAVRKETVQ